MFFTLIIVVWSHVVVILEDGFLEADSFDVGLAESFLSLADQDHRQLNAIE